MGRVNFRDEKATLGFQIFQFLHVGVLMSHKKVDNDLEE